VFTSGYVSNVAGIATIAKLLPDCLILSDALNHNSMIEGVRAAGRAKAIWRHNDLDHLEYQLRKADRDRAKLIARRPWAPFPSALQLVQQLRPSFLSHHEVPTVRRSTGVVVIMASPKTCHDSAGLVIAPGPRWRAYSFATQSMNTRTRRLSWRFRGYRT
jgi:hypothetical protein